jgi:hypothetical protein
MRETPTMRGTPMLRTTYRGARPRTHAIREGIVVGLVGAGIVMLWFLIVDLMAGTPLNTPALLGAALFDRVSDAKTVEPTARLVVGYTAVHLAGFVGFGLAVAGLLALAEREKRVLALIFLLGACLAVVFLVLCYILAQWLGQAMTPGIFLSGHLAGGAAMVAALAYYHGRLLRRMGEALDGD